MSLGIECDDCAGEVDTGTSFASPHVAGVLAELASMNPDMALADVQSLLFSNALDGVVSGVTKGTVDKLVHHKC